MEIVSKVCVFLGVRMLLTFLLLLVYNNLLVPEISTPVASFVSVFSLYLFLELILNCNNILSNFILKLMRRSK